MPTHGDVPSWLGCRPQEVTLAASGILLSDFSESCMPYASGPQRTYCHAPLRVTRPEAHFGPGDDELQKNWVQVLGRLPDECWNAWDGKSRRNVFTEDGLVRPDREVYFLNCDPGLEASFEKMVQEPRREEDLHRFLDDEKAALLDILRSMLAYKPGDLINAQELLCAEWTTRWGLSALDYMRKPGS